MNNSFKENAGIKKIMVVEDDKDIVRLLRYNLEKIGFEIIQAFDGEEGLTMVKANMPDLIILDLMLPKVDGFEFLSTIKSDPLFSRIPVIILSAKINPGAIIKGFNLGAIDYIPKPFNVGELALKVKKTLEEAKVHYGNDKDAQGLFMERKG